MKSQLIMYVVNFVILALGAAITGVSALVLTHHKDILDNVEVGSTTGEDLGTAVLNKGAIMSLVTGVALMFMGILGCCAAKNFEKGWAKFVLCLYTVLALLAFVLALSAGVIELVLSNKLMKYDQLQSTDDQLYKSLGKLSNKTYSVCCTDGKGDVAPQTSKKGCEIIKTVITAKNCADPADFQTSFFDFLSHKLHPMGAFSLAMGVISFCVLIASCCLLWRTHNDAKDAKKQRLVDPEKGQQQPGGIYNGQQYAPPTANRV